MDRFLLVFFSDEPPLLGSRAPQQPLKSGVPDPQCFLIVVRAQSSAFHWTSKSQRPLSGPRLVFYFLKEA